MELHGRRKIYTAVSEITAENVIYEVNKALAYHMANVAEMNYLYWYRRGVQPVLQRKKEIRPEICNKVVVNHAAAVVTFKNGYFLTRPVTYVSRKDDEATTNKVKKLNELIYRSGKNEADNEIVDNFHGLGLGALFVEPNRDDEDKGKPFCAYSVDPRSAFCVYSLKPGCKVAYGVNIVMDDTNVYADVFTDRYVFHCTGTTDTYDTTTTSAGHAGMLSKLESVQPNIIGLVPIIEYQANEMRMAAFEPAITVMDAYNETQSNRQDAISQTVQNLMVLYNCELPDGETANTIRENGLICLKSTSDQKADVKLMSETLDQIQTQTTLDDLYEQMLEKCGVPSSVRDGGSTSDNVGAVYLRSGWAMADTDARNTEDLYRKSNRQFTEIVSRILKQSGKLNIDMADVDICFSRNDMNNLLTKTQAALNMKQLGLAPEIAFERSGLSNDPLSDIEISKDYIDKVWSTDKQETVETTGTGISPIDGDTEKNPVNSYSRGDRSDSDGTNNSD